MSLKNEEYIKNIIREMIALPNETEWVEFKVNKDDPKMIGEYISALSNVASILKREKAYLIWGVDDKTHEILGTKFDYRDKKNGNEELEAWLLRMLNPRINFKFHEVFIDDKKIIVLDIPRAEKQPTKFYGESYIRVGTNKKKLKDCPEKEKVLWKSFDDISDELKIAKENLNFEEIFNELNFVEYYKKLEISLPENKNKIMEDFINEKFVKKNDAGNYNITNLGALLISKNIENFDKISHKFVRVIWYKDSSKLETIRERKFNEGYVVSYEKIIDYITTIIPQEEIIENSIRKIKLSYPEIAIRELVANIIIHQSIEQKGTSLMIELFDNRIEFSNPGAPLISIDRIVDTVPISRNEALAGFMHRCGICEERGSGYDKVIFSTNKYNMLAPKIENQSDKFTKVTLYSKIPFELTTKKDRIRTCYMHSCLFYVKGEPINNNSVREIFGFEAKDKYKASRIIKDTLEAELIKSVDENTAPRYMKYIPFWA